MRGRRALVVTAILLTAGVAGWYWSERDKPSPTPTGGEQEQSAVKSPPVVEEGLLPPVAEFRERITNKKFGQLITPANSPVQPERFSGYHTGVDVEYADVQAGVPVLSIMDGEVVVSGRVAGYGGVVVIRHRIGVVERLALYGHLAPQSLVAQGVAVKRGQQIGHLGAGGTSETDGERKHLHFGVLAASEINYRGYVSSETELSGWLDPLSLYK